MSLDVHTIKALKDAGLSAQQITKILSTTDNRSINTTQSIKEKTEDTSKIQRQLHSAARKFATEKKVDVSIAVPYGTYTGGFIKVGVNGVAVELPANGKTYKVSLSIAKALKERLHNLDAMYSKTGPSLGATSVSDYMSVGGLASGKIGTSDGFKKVDTVDYSG